jgi:hypothetical protein
MLAYELLKKAEILTSPSGYITDNKMRMKLRAVTFNNFGCFYKRRGKLHAALQVFTNHQIRVKHDRNGRMFVTCARILLAIACIAVGGGRACACLYSVCSVHVFGSSLFEICLS